MRTTAEKHGAFVSKNDRKSESKDLWWWKYINWGKPETLKDEISLLQKYILKKKNLDHFWSISCLKWHHDKNAMMEPLDDSDMEITVWNKKADWMAGLYPQSTSIEVSQTTVYYTLQ